MSAVESGVYLGAILRADEKREAYLESEVFETPVEANLEVGKRDSFERAGSKKIALIVDDEEVLRALQTILVSYGYETVLAEDGVEYANTNGMPKISVVILDVNMPRVDGGKVFERIRSDGNCIPIIMTSGNDDRQALPFKDGDKENCDFLA